MSDQITATQTVDGSDLKSTCFALPRMPWEPEDEYTIRVCIPGIDNGSGVFLESIVNRPSYVAAQEFAQHIAASLNAGVHYRP